MNSRRRRRMLIWPSRATFTVDQAVARASTEQASRGPTESRCVLNKGNPGIQNARWNGRLLEPEQSDQAGHDDHLQRNDCQRQAIENGATEGECHKKRSSSRLGNLHARDVDRGTPSVHPMQGDEIRALRRLQCEQEASSHVFTSERGGPMTPKSFHTLISRLGERADMPF